MNSVLKGVSKDAILDSFEITFTYLPTYTATGSHKPGSDTRIYRQEHPNLSKSNACNNCFFLPLYDYKYMRWAKQAYEFLELAVLSHAYVHITYLSPTDNVQIWYMKHSGY
jgi:hypothetical protein